MSEAYTKLGIEIEVGKKVTVHTDGVTDAAGKLNTAFNEAFKEANIFKNLAKGISELAAKLSGVSFGNVTKGITEVKTALNSLNTSTEVKVSMSTDEARKQLNSFLIETKKLKDTNITGGLQLKVSAPVVDIASVKASLSNTLTQLQTMYKEGTKSFFTNPGGMAASYNSQKMTEVAVNPNTDLKTLQSFAKIVSAALDDNYKTTRKSKAALVEYLTVADSSGFARLAQAFKTTMKLPKIDQGSDKSIETLIKNLKKVEDNDSLGKFNQDLIRVLSSLQRLAGVDTSKIKLPSLSTANPNFVPEGRALSSLYSTRRDLSVPPSSLTTPFREKYFSGATQTAGLTQAAEAISQTSKQAQAEIAKNKAEVDNLIVRIKDLEKSNKTLQAELTKASEGRLVYSAKAMEIAATSLNVDRSKLKEALELYSAQQQAQKAVYEKTKGDAGVFANPNQKLLDQQRKEQEQQGTQLLAALKNTRTATKEEQDKIVTNWQQYLAALKNSGQQYYNGSVVPKTYVTDTGNAWTAAHAEQSRRATAQVQEDQRKVIYSGYANRDADGAYQAYLANTTKLQSEERRQQEEHGKQLLATIKNTNSMEKAERDKAAEDWKQYLAALKNSGQQYYNGSVVPKSYITDVGNARSAAIAEESKRNKITPTSQIVDPVKAESLARIQQAFNVLDQLKRTASSTKVTADEVAEAFRRAGVNISQLENRSANNLVAGLRGIKIEAGAVNNTFKNGGKEVSAWTKLFGESIGKMAARLTEFYSLRTMILAVGSQFREAVAGSIDFQQNIRDIAAIAGSSRTEMEGLGKSILGIAKDSRFSANEVSELMQVLAQAGIKARDLGEVSSVVGQFATATASKPEVAADVFTTTLTVFKKEASESTEIANALTAALNNSKLTTQGLATAFNYLAPQAAQFGMTMEQTLGVVAGMSQAGVKASTIGTGVSQLLKELAVPKERLKNLLDYYGLKAEEVNPKLRTFAEVVETLNTAVGRAGEKGVQTEHLFAALESRVGRSVVTAVTLGADTFTNMTNSITGTNAATVAFEKTMEGPRAKINVLKQEVLSFAVATGSALGPALSGAVELVTSAVRGLSTAPGALAQLAVGIGTVAVSVRALTIAAMANPIIAGVTVGVAAITAALAYFGRETDETVIKAEEQRKAYVGMAESTQRVKDVTSAAVVEAERNNSELKKYTELLKGNEKQQQQAIELGGTYVDIKSETKKSLYGLKDAHKDWFANIDLENLKLSDLHKILRLVNEERARGTQASIESYNEVQSKINELEPKLKADRDKSTAYNRPGQARTSLTEFMSDDWANSWVNPDSLKRRQTQLDTLQATKQKTYASMDSETLSSKYKRDANGLIIPKTSEDVARDQAALDELAKKRKAVAPIPKAGGSKKDKHESYRNKDVAEALKAESAAMKSIVQEQTEILKDTEKTFDERNAAFELAKEKILQHNANDLYADVLSETRKLVDANGVKGYDAGAHLEALQAGKGSEFKLSGVNSADYEVYVGKIKALNEKSQAAYSKEMSHLTKANLDTNKKFSEEYTKITAKIDDDELKRREELAKKNLEFSFRQSGVSAMQAMQTYYDYIQAEEAKIVAKYQKENDALFDAFYKKSPEDQTRDWEAFLAEGAKITSAKKDAMDANRVGAASIATSGIESRINKEEKALSLELSLGQSALALQRERAWTGEDLNRIATEEIALNIKNATSKEALYTTALDRETAFKNAILTRLTLTAEELDAKIALGNIKGIDLSEILIYQNAAEKVQAYIDKLKALKGEKDGLANKQKQQEDTSFLGNFTQGIQSAWTKLDDFKASTKQLGSDLTNSLTSGVSSTISSTFTTMFNPDQQKIAEAQAKITELNTQKATLEAEINTISANSSKSPQDLKDLADKKVALDNVNNSLKQQNEEVRKQKDGWAAFSEGLKGIMKSILQELQTYIAKLFAVWAIKKLVGLADNSVVGDTFPSLFGYAEGGEVQKLATGGIVNGYADGGLVNGISGGLIPSTMGIPGKDSVPIMAMPNEYIIPADVVRTWSAGHFENYRNGTFKKMAEGGLASGKAPSAPSSNSNQKQEWTLQIVNMVQGQDHIPNPGDQAQQIVNVINSDIARRGPTYRTIKAAVAG